MARNALDGIRIMDFTWAGAGPYATLLMALFGAEVIKVENHRHLDTNRTRNPGNLENSWRFNDLNLNKMSVTMDLSVPEARELVTGLAQVCDVVIQNFRPGGMARLGADYASLSSRNPSVIMVSSSSRGSVGPERDYLGFAS
ncbi:MAG: CoA transferase, partial [Chloroflexota bacterium]